MKASKALAAAALVAGLLGAGQIVHAQGADHQAHHPEQSAQTGQSGTGAAATPTPEQKPATQAMGPDQMKQMQEMCSKMMAGGMGMMGGAGGMAGGMGGGMGGGGMGMMGGGMGQPAAAGDTGPASQAFAAANARMHQGMAITFTGDADVDFTKGMIAHHQGAIDMAKVVLQHGKDEKIRKLAEDIVKAQEAEIALMTDWLKSKAK